MKLVCIGDSTTYGQNVRACEAWPAVLERLTGYDVRNAGVCGDTTRLGLERFPRDVQLQQPDCVVLQFGANDANRWESDGGVERVGVDAYVANIRDLVARCFAIGASVIVLRPHQPQTADQHYNERVTLYAIAIKRERDLESVSYCAPVVSLLDDGYGVHPDVMMHERYAELVMEAL